MTTQDPRYKHKPSEKHTLEEVLKSLQDLIRNDLPEEKTAGNDTGAPQADGRPSEQIPQEPGVQHPPREHSTAVREDFAPVNPAAGPVNLDAVMRSLKDLIGNELNVGDRSTPGEEPPPLVSNEDVLESAAEELAPLDEEPIFEEPDEIIPGDELALPGEDITPPLPEENILESAAEELAPLDEEPIFEEPDEIIPGDELALPGEDITPPLPEENILESAAEELAPLDEEPAFDEAVDLDLGTEITPPEETPAMPPEQQASEDKSSEEPTTLDEELTLAETAEAAPPAEPDLSGEISSETNAEPVTTQPGAEEKSEEQIITTDSQQELLFDEPAPLIIERQPPDRETGQNSETKPEPAVENPAPDSPRQATAQNLEGQPEETLPTIEVEETLEESAYFDVETPQVEPAPEEVVAPAIEPPTVPEATASETAGGDGEKSGSEPTVVPTPEVAPSKTDLKLEIEDEPATEIPQSPASVDFDSIDLTASEEPPDLSSVPVEPMPAASEPSETERSVRSMPSIDFETVSLETDRDKQAPSSPSEAASPAPASEAPVAVETPVAPESTSEVTMTKKPAPDEINEEAAAESEPGKAPDDKAVATADETRETPPAAVSESGSGAKPPPFNLDDIPVLHEVVAPPAGSMLAPVARPPQTPLPAPDRARDIVVRAVAKLNVELRKSGGAGLDTKTILRLQKLIRQEMEKDGKK